MVAGHLNQAVIPGAVNCGGVDQRPYNTSIMTASVAASEQSWIAYPMGDSGEQLLASRKNSDEKSGNVIHSNYNEPSYQQNC